MNVLIVEDGHEYTETLTRFAGDAITWIRAGTGEEALACLQQGGVDAVFLDMRFDRVPDEVLLGGLAQMVERFGDRSRAVHFLQENQGAVILKAIRDAGHTLPVLFSYNFDEEPRRWERVKAAYSPVAYAMDSESPMRVAERLLGMR